MYHHRVVAGIEIRLVPHALVEILHREHLPRVGGQQIQNAVLRSCQGHLLPVLPHQALVRIDLDISAAAQEVAGGGLGAVDTVAPQHGLHPGDKFRVGKRFHQIVIAPHGKAHGLVRILGSGRQKQHRHRRLLADLGAGGIASRTGHHHIQNYKIHGAVEQRDGLAAIGSFQHLVALSCQQQPQHLPNFGVIVCHQNLSRLHRAASSPCVFYHYTGFSEQ